MKIKTLKNIMNLKNKIRTLMIILVVITSGPGLETSEVRRFFGVPVCHLIGWIGIIWGEIIVLCGKMG